MRQLIRCVPACLIAVLYLTLDAAPSLAAPKQAYLLPAQYFTKTTTAGKTIACLRDGTSHPGDLKAKKRGVVFVEIVGRLQRDLAKAQKKQTPKSQAKAAALAAYLTELFALCAQDPGAPGGGGNGGGGGTGDGGSGGGDVLQPAADTLSVEDAQHLYRRAGFGGTAEEISTAVSAGLRATVEKLLTVVPTPAIDQQAQGVFDGDPDPESPPDYFTDEGVRYAFLLHMLKSPNQLREKMAYFWHDLFAASYRVLGGQDGHFVYDYYRILRENALGNVRTLAHQMTTNGLMLTWLDGAKNRVGQVNENYAREFWERFSLGRDQYTEHDIAEAARAYTGWTIRYDDQTERDQVVFIPSNVDTSVKTIFENTPWQQSGAFTAYDIVDRTLDAHPTAPRYFALQLYRFLVHEEPSGAIVAALAGDLKRSNYEITPLVRRILLSREFFASSARKSGVKTPIEYALGLLRNLGLSTFDIRYVDQSIRNMGQTLLAPPSVKGWDDDDYWLNDQWMAARASFVHEVLNEASPIIDNFSLAYLLPSPTATGTQFLAAVSARLGIHLSAARSANIDRYLNYVRQWDDTDEPWLFDPRHTENFEIKARGLLFILAQDDDYQLD
ncbi:MAG: DUF1800 domain-containing protein [Bdellovibrionota bacterium]